MAARRVGAGEIAHWNAERPVSAGAYRARVHLPHGVESMAAESLQHVQVEVTNLGDEWWPRGPVPGPLIRVGHRWWDEDGEEIVMATVRTPFTETVPPGATTRLTMAIQSPPVTGRLGLRVDVVHEDVRWFECEERLTVEVTPAYTDGFFSTTTSARGSRPAWSYRRFCRCLRRAAWSTSVVASGPGWRSYANLGSTTC